MFVQHFIKNPFDSYLDVSVQSCRLFKNVLEATSQPGSYMLDTEPLICKAVLGLGHSCLAMNQALICGTSS